MKSLLGILNSSIQSFYLHQISSPFRGGYIALNRQYIEQLPIFQISKTAQVTYETLVDYILFAKAHEIETEANALEWLIDVMVFGLYFEAEMKAAECFINDRVDEVIKPIKPDDTDEFKRNYIQKLVSFCDTDPVLRHGLVHCRTVEPVKIVLEAGQPKETPKKAAKAKK